MAKGRSLPTGQRRRFDPESREPLARQRQHGVEHVHGVFGMSDYSAIVATSDPALVAEYQDWLAWAMRQPDAVLDDIERTA